MSCCSVPVENSIGLALLLAELPATDCSYLLHTHSFKIQITYIQYGYTDLISEVKAFNCDEVFVYTYAQIHPLKYGVYMVRF